LAGHLARTTLQSLLRHAGSRWNADTRAPLDVPGPACREAPASECGAIGPPSVPASPIAPRDWGNAVERLDPHGLLAHMAAEWDPAPGLEPVGLDGLEAKVQQPKVPDTLLGVE